MIQCICNGCKKSYESRTWNIYEKGKMVERLMVECKACGKDELVTDKMVNFETVHSTKKK